MEATERANELYWASDRSVNQIADELDLSKGALYEMIRPEPAEAGCPLCGTGAVYPNRTAKERGRVECPACAWSGTVAEADEGAEGAGIETAAVDRRPGPLPARVTGELARTIAGGALLGAAVGLALVLWARRR